jgi:hypothetical protein
MSDYPQRVREFAQLNPGLWVAQNSSPQKFADIARLLEHEQTLGWHVTEALRLGENVRSPDSAMAAVAERARVARSIAAERAKRASEPDLGDFSPPPSLRQRIAARIHQQPTRQGAER